ncbi:hypothetical protein [Vibrio phage vB_pir03]|nr:hypothetical protein [Vibrio phage vB_pir03]
MSALLNWDHEVNPTSFGDIQLNALEELKKLGMHIAPNRDFIVYNGTKVAYMNEESIIVYDRIADAATGPAGYLMDKREAIINEYNTYVK